MAFENSSERFPAGWVRPERQLDALPGESERSPHILLYWLGGFIGSLAVWVAVWRILVMVLR